MSEGQYTRQVTTIASIDAVGFSRLMGIDDEFAVAAFEERRSIIADSCDAAGGRTFGAAGDSIMAEFGTPIDALRAAFDFQQRIVTLNNRVSDEMRMQFRVGINTGNVIVPGNFRDHLEPRKRKGCGTIYRSGRADAQEYCPSGTGLRCKQGRRR